MADANNYLDAYHSEVNRHGSTGMELRNHLILWHFCRIMEFVEAVRFRKSRTVFAGCGFDGYRD